MRLETERLILREPALKDEDAVWAILSDAETCRCDGGYPPFVSKDEAFGRLFAKMVSENEERLFMEDKASGRMIGFLHLMKAEETGAVELGYVVHRDFRRRGLASEAVRAVLAQLRQQGVKTVICTVYCFNEASIRMLEKLGFLYIERKMADNPEWDEAVYRMELK